MRFWTDIFIILIILLGFVCEFGDRREERILDKMKDQVKGTESFGM